MTVQHVNQTAGTVPNVDTDGAGGHYCLAEMGGVDENGVFQQMTVNQDVVALVSATRTATTASGPFVNQNAGGVIVILNVTAASGTGGLHPQVQMLDPASGNWVSLQQSPPAVTTVTTLCYVLYPGVTGGNTAQDQGIPLSRTFRVQVTHNDASNYTYSVGFSLVE